MNFTLKIPLDKTVIRTFPKPKPKYYGYFCSSSCPFYRQNEDKYNCSKYFAQLRKLQNVERCKECLCNWS